MLVSPLTAGMHVSCHIKDGSDATIVEGIETPHPLSLLRTVEQDGQNDSS